MSSLAYLTPMVQEQKRLEINICRIAGVSSTVTFQTTKKQK